MVEEREEELVPGAGHGPWPGFAPGRELPIAYARFQPLQGTELPIYRLDGPQYATFYAPGCLCVVARYDVDWFQASLAHQARGPVTSANEPLRYPGAARASSSRPAGEDWANQLWRYAVRAMREAERRRAEDFQPECLTLYLNNECNLGCTYCYANPSREPSQRLDLDTIAAGASLVAANCRRKGRPFYAVFHGGGEPTLCHNHIEAALDVVEAAARASDLDIVRYVATNGLLSEDKAVWLAGRFDLIGLSCDGPPAIHDRQRPRADGRGSSETVKRIAHILRQEGAVLHVRATITRRSLHRQAEVAEYICSQLAPHEIHFEPVYRGGRTSAAISLSADQAPAYVTHFLAAQGVANAYGIPLYGTGSRPADIHGPFCHVFRQVLNLLPGGLATACFKISRADETSEKDAAIGLLNRVTGRFEIDQRHVQALRRRLGEHLVACRVCFNRYHCARECPDHCPLDGERPGIGAEPGFRCRVQQAMTLAVLQQAAARLWTQVETGAEKGPHGTRDLGPRTA